METLRSDWLNALRNDNPDMLFSFDGAVNSRDAKFWEVEFDVEMPSQRKNLNESSSFILEKIFSTASGNSMWNECLKLEHVWPFQNPCWLLEGSVYKWPRILGNLYLNIKVQMLLLSTTDCGPFLIQYYIRLMGFQQFGMKRQRTMSIWNSQTLWQYLIEGCIF